MKNDIFKLNAIIICCSIIIRCDLTNGSRSPQEGENLCRELAGSSYMPVAIDEVLAVARDSSGMLYAIDKADHTYRVFVSSNDTLYRRYVKGSGVMSERYYFLSVEDGSRFIFRNDNGEWSNVYRCSGDGCGNYDSILSSRIDPESKERGTFDEKMEEGWNAMCDYLDSACDECRPLIRSDTAAVADYAVRNITPVTHIEYLASHQGGWYLLVSRVEYDWNGDVVLHYGTGDTMKKRYVTSFMRATDGGSTWIRFMVGFHEAEAFFGVQWDTSGVTPGQSYLVQESDTLQLERLVPEEELLAQLGFDCSHEIR